MEIELVGAPWSRGISLAARLREDTRAEHLAAERAFDLPLRLRSVDDYADVLAIMDRFQRAATPALTLLAERLPAALRDGARRRRERLACDLHALGRTPDPAGASATVEVDLDRALGTWYVHEGAALGGVVIASEVVRQLPAAAVATRYFRGEGRGTAARWRAVQAVLDESGERGEDVAQRALAGARETFADLRARLQEGG